MGGAGSGRKKKTVAERVRDNTYRPTKHGQPDGHNPALVSMPPMNDRKPPHGLNQHGAAEWDRLFDYVSKELLVTEGERMLFYWYCWHWGEAKAATDKIAVDGSVWKKPKAAGDKDADDVGERYSKYYLHAERSAKNMLDFAIRLGLSSVDRGRVVKNRTAGAPVTHAKTTAAAKGSPLSMLTAPIVLPFNTPG